MTKLIMFIIFLMVMATYDPANTIGNNEVSSNETDEVEQINIIQEEIETNNETEYMYIPVSNGKTIQMVSIPKAEKGE